MSWVFMPVSRNVVRGLFAAFCLWAASGVNAQQALAEKSPPAVDTRPLTAHQVVEKVTSQMLSVIQQNKGSIEEKPQHYYTEVRHVLDPVVDFGFIARGVMGAYAKQATPEQRERFTTTFKIGLIETYAKGMAGFGDRQIVVLPPNGDISGQRTVSVTQEVQGPDGVNRVSYTMKRKGQEWKLVNVILNGVNLGKTFRNQFAQAMKKNGGDLNSVIDGWSAAG